MRFVIAPFAAGSTRFARELCPYESPLPLSTAWLLLSTLLLWEPSAKDEQAMQADSVLITLIDQAEVPAQEAGRAGRGRGARRRKWWPTGELLAQVDDSAAQITKRRARPNWTSPPKKKPTTSSCATPRTRWPRPKPSCSGRPRRWKNIARASPAPRSTNCVWPSTKPRSRSSRPNTTWPWLN